MFFPLSKPLFTSFFLWLASVTIASITLADEGNNLVISYRDEQGVVQTLDTSKHKLTALHFWATWCVPCVEELPQMDTTQATYADKDFAIVTLSMDMKREKITQFFKNHKIAHLPAYTDNQMKTFQALQIRGVPTTIFFDNNKNQIKRVEEPVNWEDQEVVEFIENHLK